MGMCLHCKLFACNSLQAGLRPSTDVDLNTFEQLTQISWVMKHMRICELCLNMSTLCIVLKCCCVTAHSNPLSSHVKLWSDLQLQLLTVSASGSC